MKTKSLLIGVGTLAFAALPALADDNKLKAMDNDGDGRISKSEHAEVARTGFGKLDTNSDGVLNADEISAAKEKKPNRSRWSAQRS